MQSHFASSGETEQKSRAHFPFAMCALSGRAARGLLQLRITENEKCCREISSRAQPTRRSVQLSASANKIKARVIFIPILSPRPLCKIRVCKLKSLAAAGSDLFHSDGCRVFYIIYIRRTRHSLERQFRSEWKQKLRMRIPHIRIKYITALSMGENI